MKAFNGLDRYGDGSVIGVTSKKQDNRGELRMIKGTEEIWMQSIQTKYDIPLEYSECSTPFIQPQIYRLHTVFQCISSEANSKFGYTVVQLQRSE